MTLSCRSKTFCEIVTVTRVTVSCSFLCDVDDSNAWRFLRNSNFSHLRSWADRLKSEQKLNFTTIPLQVAKLFVTVLKIYDVKKLLSNRFCYTWQCNTLYRIQRFVAFTIWLNLIKKDDSMSRRSLWDGCRVLITYLIITYIRDTNFRDFRDLKKKSRN